MGAADVAAGAPEVGVDGLEFDVGMAKVPGNWAEIEVGVDDVPGHGGPILGLGLGVGNGLGLGVGSAKAVPTVRAKVARQAPAASSKLRGRIRVGVL